MINTLKITSTVSVTVGRSVQIHPIENAPAGVATSSAIPTCDGPTNAMIIDAWLGDAILPAAERPRVQVRLYAPGKANHGRMLVLPHTGLDDAVNQGTMVLHLACGCSPTWSLASAWRREGESTSRHTCAIHGDQRIDSIDENNDGNPL